LVCIAAQEGKRAIVIGSSFISMELVVAFGKRKLASIDVIGMEEFPFEVVLGKEVGAGQKTVGLRTFYYECFLMVIVTAVSRISRSQVPYANQGGKDYTERG
jgi:hypothetical protein